MLIAVLLIVAELVGSGMRELFVLLAHLLTTLVKLCRPGGFYAVAAESLAVKHQLHVMSRSRRRAPRLTPWDRLVFGLCACCIPMKRFEKCAIILKPSSFTRFHQALVCSKYRWLYSPGKRARPGPKGPSKEVVAAVVEMKRRNHDSVVRRSQNRSRKRSVSFSIKTQCVGS